MSDFDLVVKNGKVVTPYVGVTDADIGILDGKISAIETSIDSSRAKEVIDAEGKAVFPGACDVHFHIGIYHPIEESAENETRSSLVGGVTTIVSYFRSGSHYLERTGSYKELFPEVVNRTTGHAYTDFSYHIAAMEDSQIDEIEWLVDQGVGSFKYFMFYKGMNLHGNNTDPKAMTMTGDPYDLGHLYKYMKKVKEMQDKYADKGRISLSLHCEHAELLRVFLEEAREKGIEGLQGYHEGRPALTEELAITEAAVLAKATGCPVNFLHLSSKEAFETADEFRRLNPQLDIITETTLHHLALTWETSYEPEGRTWGKVNPPIREAKDNDALWAAVEQGRIDQVVSDHACVEEENKGDLWEAYAGFGGTALLYPLMISDGHHKRGMKLEKIAELVAANPAQTVGIYPKKGTIAVGSDADLAIIDLDKEQKVTADLLLSGQQFSNFQDYEIKGWPVMTIRRGELMYKDGEVVGTTSGEFIKRPIGVHK
ncbi:MAG: dihydroorotase [Dehalococcoidia bacterium]|tara:strand:+ start:7555 stop:9009 length:1455 start_codon:yes stop_codon:yes gene_type:complete